MICQCVESLLCFFDTRYGKSVSGFFYLQESVSFLRVYYDLIRETY